MSIYSGIGCINDTYCISVYSRSCDISGSTVILLSKMVPGWCGGEELLNKVVIFVLFVHKKYYCGFVELWLNHWCHMDYFNDVLTVSGSGNISVMLLYMQGQRAFCFHQKYFNLCSKDEQRSYGFGTTWVWVINDRILIFSKAYLCIICITNRSETPCK